MFYNMKKKILIFAFIFLIMPGLKAGEIERISEIMPSGTELLSQSKSPENALSSGIAYKYGTTATKESISEFYQNFLLGEGYANIRKEINDKGSTFVFKKEEQLVAVAILNQQENGLSICHVILSEPNPNYKRSEKYERLRSGK